MLGLCCCTGFSLVVVVQGLFIEEASLVVEHELESLHASVVVGHGLGCCVACGIFPDQGLNLCLLHW